MKKKFLTAVVCIAVVVVFAAGGAVAWLTAETKSVTNTFTVGKVAIELNETMNTDTGTDGVNDAWTAQLIPGKEYAKDPVVTVKAESEDGWLFVKFEEINAPKNFLDYTSALDANGWTKLTGVAGVDNVWYREVKKTDDVKSWHLLKDDKVTVNAENVTNKNMPTAENAPALKYTAYAVQRAGFDNAADAWAKL